MKQRLVSAAPGGRPSLVEESEPMTAEEFWRLEAFL